jgi:hypothetical protein
MDIKSKIRRKTRDKHGGFVITFEVIMTLVMVTTILTATLYLVKVMSAQRYMNTVLTSTTELVARWGGTDTRPYAENVSSTPIMTTAQEQLNDIAPDYSPVITCTPSKITTYSQNVSCTITYRIPTAWNNPLEDGHSKVCGVDSCTDLDNGNPLNMQAFARTTMNPGLLLDKG